MIFFLSPSWGLRIFLSHALDETKNIFLYFFTELKTYHLYYSIYKDDAIDIADPSSIQYTVYVGIAKNQGWERLNFVSLFAARLMKQKHSYY